MTEFSINAKILVGLNKYGASVDPTRYYLHGVHIEINGGIGFAVATNGHVMFIHRFEAETADAKFIISSTLLKNLKVDKKIKDVQVKYDGKTIHLSYGALNLSGAEIDGNYPDWRRAVTSEIEFKDQYVEFGPDVLDDVYKMHKSADGKGRPGLVPNGGGPALVNFGRKDLTGFAMPVRTGPDLRDGAKFKPPFEFN